MILSNKKRAQKLISEIGSTADIYALSTKYNTKVCLLYTSDAADERSSVDLGGRRIIKKKIIQKKNTDQQRVIHR